MDNEERLAVFIDYDNLALGAREHLGGMQFDFGPIADALAVRGRVVARRAYADWSYFSEDRRMLTRHQVDLIEMTQRMGASRKNAADIKMVVDAIEMAFERDYITTFVMCTGDSDFSPLVHKLRELNKRVIGVGVEQSTSRLLPAACDEFLFYDRLEGVDVPDNDAGRIQRRLVGSGKTKEVVDDDATRGKRQFADGSEGKEVVDERSEEHERGAGRSHRSRPATRPATRHSPDVASDLPKTDPADNKESKLAALAESLPAAEQSPRRATRKAPARSDATAGAAESTPPVGPVEVANNDEPEHREETLEVQVAQTLANLAASTNGAVKASALKRTLLRKDPTFSESDYGFRTFTEFLEFLSERGFVELPAGTAGDPEVALPRQGSVDETFALVREVVSSAGAPVQLSGLKNRLRKRRPDFSEKALGYRGFLQFCRAAADAGTVSLTWDDDAEDYLVTAN